MEASLLELFITWPFKELSATWLNYSCLSDPHFIQLLRWFNLFAHRLVKYRIHPLLNLVLEGFKFRHCFLQSSFLVINLSLPMLFCFVELREQGIALVIKCLEKLVNGTDKASADLLLTHYVCHDLRAHVCHDANNLVCLR